MVFNSLSIIKNRGPDESRIILEEIDNYYICVGFNRLSILDLSSESMQPINTKKQITVFNGEIYNYNDIGENKYKSDTLFLKESIDNEKIEKVLNYIKGMFSIVSIDIERKGIYFASDIFGQKPGYYLHNNSYLIFSSQISPILKFDFYKKSLNLKSLNNYKKYNFIHGEETIFKNIKSIQPNKLISFSFSKGKIAQEGNKILKSHIYKNGVESYDYNLNNLDKVFIKTMQLHLNTDVKSCSLLSSGIDSTLITSYANLLSENHETYTINFLDKNLSELSDVQSFSKKNKILNNTIEPNKNDLLNFFENVSSIFDQPFSDSSQINQYIIFKKIKEENYKCTLSGDGGDEIFGGYNRYNYFDKVRFIRKLKFTEKILLFYLKNFLYKKNIYKYDQFHKLIKVLKTKNSTDYYFTLLNNEYANENNKVKLDINLEFENNKDDIIKLDRIFYLPYDILVKVDRTSMYNSIENRSPFLYDDLFNYSEVNNLIKFGKKKEILHKLLYKRFKTKINNKKKGFGFSIENYLLRNKNFYDIINDILNEGLKNYYELINGKELEILIEKFRDGSNIFNFVIWNRIILILWLKKYS